MDMRDLAVAWAERGFRVFRLPVGQSFPPPKDFPRIATSDPDAVRRLWTAESGNALRFNIGVATDEWVVADADVKNGKRGLESVDALQLELDTLTVRTPSGGFHFYYKDVGPVSNRADMLGKDSGLDVRGFHGYVVAPGSRTEKGVYELVRDAAPAAVPPLLAERLRAPVERASDVPVGELDTPAKVEQAIHFLEHEPPATIEPDVYRVCAKLRGIGISAELAQDLIVKHFYPRCPGWENPGNDELDWLAARIAHAEAYGIGAPGSEAVEFLLAGIDIPPEPERDFGFTDWTMHGDMPREPYNWLFYQTLPAQGTTMLFAPSGAGKTFLELELARALATGKPFFGETADERGGTAFVFGQTEGALFEERLMALGEPERLPIGGVTVGPLSLEGALPKLMEKLGDFKTKVLEAFGVPLRLVIFDTFYAMALTDDPNDPTKVTVAIGALAALGKALGVAVMFAHHPTKRGDSYSGSQAFEGAVDCALEIEWEKPRAQRTLKLVKARGAPYRTVGQFTLVPAPLGFDARGRQIESCYVSTSTSLVAASTMPGPNSQAQRLVDLLNMLQGGEQDLQVIEGKKWVPEGVLFDLYADGCKFKVPMDQYTKAIREAIEAHMIIEFTGPTSTVLLAPNQGL